MRKSPPAAATSGADRTAPTSGPTSTAETPAAAALADGSRSAGSRGAVARNSVTRRSVARSTVARSAAARRAAVATAVLPVLLLGAACSGGSSDADGTSHTSPTAASSLAGHAPLTVQQLTQALVTDTDVPGWVVQQTSDDNGVQTTAPSQFDPDAMMGMADSNGQAVLESDRPECQPLADVASAKPKIHRMASVGATFAQEAATAPPGPVRTTAAPSAGTAKGGAAKAAGPEVVNQMLIASHAPGDAQRVMNSIRTALHACTAFNGEDGQGSRTPFTITPGTAPKIGDEAVAYLMTDTSDKKTGAAQVTVVRTGDTVTSYLSTKAAGGAGPVPLAIARKQSAKLAALLARRK